MNYTANQKKSKSEEGKSILASFLPNMSFIIYIERIRNRFWVIPTAIVLLLIALSLLSVHIPNPKTESDHWYSFLLQGYSAAGARLILSSVATSLMTVIGVLFSLTVVILQQVSNQYSPRVIENFVRSYSSQIMLGVFVGTFVYCILLLRQVHESTDGSEAVIPQIGVSTAIFLSLVSTAFLIHYIDHITQAIRSTNIIASIRNDAKSYFNDYRVFLHKHATVLQSIKGSNFYELRNTCAGYLQNIEPEQLSEDLKKCGPNLVNCLVAPGQFLQADTLLAEVYSEKPLTDAQKNSARSTFKIGTSRTHAQDFLYGLRQLTDVAMRALSPGINDPTTAMEALNSIGDVVLHYINNWPLPAKIATDEKITIIEFNHPNLDEVIEIAFSQIVELGKSHMPVLLRAAEILELASAKLPTEEGRTSLGHTLKSIRNSVKNCDNSFLYRKSKDILATT